MVHVQYMVIVKHIDIEYITVKSPLYNTRYHHIVLVELVLLYTVNKCEQIHKYGALRLMFLEI